MTQPRRAAFTLVAALAIGLTSAVAIDAQRENDGRKPSLALRATPLLGFSPLRVRVVVDVRGGADDFQDFYCPSIEWDWSDGTVSESSENSDPYQASKSTIGLRLTPDHTYRQSQPESYRIVFRMKQKDRTDATATTTVQVRAGAGEDFDR